VLFHLSPEVSVLEQVISESLVPANLLASTEKSSPRNPTETELMAVVVEPQGQGVI